MILIASIVIFVIVDIRENMKQGLAAKVNALDLFERELLKIANGFIALSSATESWMRNQP